MGIRRPVARGIYRTLAETYDAEGKFYFEMWIRSAGSGKTWCDMAIHFIDPQPHKAHDLLVGIEVKDWKDPVPPSVIKKEFEGYGNQFDYFYFAANEYAPSVDEMDIDEIGLIDMSNDFEVIEYARAQETRSWNRHDFIQALNRNWKRKREQLAEDYPELVKRADGEQPKLDAFHPEQEALTDGD